VTPLLVAAGAAALGYVARVLVERYIHGRRERVLRALGGELPDWEKRARELETEAHHQITAQKVLNGAKEWARFFQSEAEITRKRGRRRDREWR